MHEHTFIEAILRNVENRENVKEIVLEVGELVGIEAGHLREHILERFGGWDVKVREKESRVLCPQLDSSSNQTGQGCGFEGRAKVLERLHDLVIFECAKCGGDVEVLEGDKVRILKVVYD